MAGWAAGRWVGARDFPVWAGRLTGGRFFAELGWYAQKFQRLSGDSRSIALGLSCTGHAGEWGIRDHRSACVLLQGECMRFLCPNL